MKKKKQGIGWRQRFIHFIFVKWDWSFRGTGNHYGVPEIEIRKFHALESGDLAREALICSRWQWIHSINAAQCLIALGEDPLPIIIKQVKNGIRKNFRTLERMGFKVVDTPCGATRILSPASSWAYSCAACSACEEDARADDGRAE